jgi:hypothetical protein
LHWIWSIFLCLLSSSTDWNKFTHMHSCKMKFSVSNFEIICLLIFKVFQKLWQRIFILTKSWDFLTTELTFISYESYKVNVPLYISSLENCGLLQPRTTYRAIFFNRTTVILNLRWLIYECGSAILNEDSLSKMSYMVK